MKITDLRCAVIGKHPIVRIVTDEGLYGLGEVEWTKTYLKPFVMHFRDALIGEDPTDVERCMMKIRQRGSFKIVERHVIGAGAAALGQACTGVVDHHLAHRAGRGGEEVLTTFIAGIDARREQLQISLIDQRPCVQGATALVPPEFGMSKSDQVGVHLIEHFRARGRVGRRLGHLLGQSGVAHPSVPVRSCDDATTFAHTTSRRRSGAMPTSQR